MGEGMYSLVYQVGAGMYYMTLSFIGMDVRYVILSLGVLHGIICGGGVVLYDTLS